MSLLLDTHIALWFLTRSHLLTDPEKGTIARSKQDLYVSVISLWETAIKRALNPTRSDLPPLSAEMMEKGLVATGVKLLAVTARHAIAIEALPPRHKDPFDRMIAAQAMSEPMKVLTRDQAVLDYLPAELRT